MIRQGEINITAHRTQQLKVEKRSAVAMGVMKKIKNVIAGLQMSHGSFSEVFNRVDV